MSDPAEDRGRRLGRSGFIRRTLIINVIWAPVLILAFREVIPFIFAPIIGVFLIGIHYWWAAARLRDAGLSEHFRELLFSNWNSPYSRLQVITDLYSAPTRPFPSMSTPERQVQSIGRSNLQVGDKVVHSSLGEGVIESVDGSDDNVFVLFTKNLR